MITQVTWPVLRRGSTGAGVKTAQYLLRALQDPALAADGIFGPATERTVRAFQQAAHITVDGVIGKNTWVELTGGDATTVRRGSIGEAVKAAQNELLKHGELLKPEQVDGNFGYVTETAVRDFQQRVGLTVDGVVGPLTWQQLISRPAS